MQETLVARLDERDALPRLDPFGMMALTLELPAQCEEATRRAQGWTLPPLRTQPRQILVTGLGGSGMGGDYLRCLFEAIGSLPVIVNRDYVLPAFVGPETLVFAVSYSGNTEETLAAYAHARTAGAFIITLSSGGELQTRAQRDGLPHLQVPGGQPPRTALGYLFLPLLVLCERWGLLPDLSEARARTIRRLQGRAREWSPEIPAATNPTKQMALALYQRIPLLYGTGGYRAVVATRWKQQFNENAKIHAFPNTFPELNHNEILGWVLAKQQASNLSVVALRDNTESAKVKARAEVTKQLIGDSANWHEVYAEGATLLERLMDLTYFGDFVSLYLSYLNEVDPQNIDYINHLKAELAKTP